LAGVQPALDADTKAAKAAPESAPTSAGEAVKELQSGPARSDDDKNKELFFSNLVKHFSEDKFQQSMCNALDIKDEKVMKKGSIVKIVGLKGAPHLNGERGRCEEWLADKERWVVKLEKEGEGKKTVKAENLELLEETSSVSGQAANADVSDFLGNFMKSFQQAVGGDPEFAQRMNSVMATMCPKSLIYEPVKQMADAYEPWLKEQTGLSSADRSRYESQMKLYKEIVNTFNSCDSDQLPEDMQEKVQSLFQEIHALGDPPAEMMKKMEPKEAGEGEDSFEDFVKSMGLNENLGAAEQDLLKKLTEDPEELTKVMKEMSDQVGDDPEACKQQ